jgi:hypothetical protein
VTTYVVPVLVVLMSWAFLGETPRPLAYLGGVLCLVGVAISRRRTRPTQAEPIADEPVTGKPVGEAPTAGVPVREEPFAGRPVTG